MWSSLGVYDSVTPKWPLPSSCSVTCDVTGETVQKEKGSFFFFFKVAPLKPI